MPPRFDQRTGRALALHRLFKTNMFSDPFSGIGYTRGNLTERVAMTLRSLAPALLAVSLATAFAASAPQAAVTPAAGDGTVVAEVFS